MFNVSRGVLEARSISLSFFIPTTSLEAIFLAIGKPFLQQELPTTINQINHPQAMSSGSGGIGSTLTSGVQSVAAILPLLGTEQCSIHVSSALTRGYLYAATAPMSIFGSLGVVSAGFKTMVACLSFGDFEGADLLENMGFEPQGENLSLIMFEGGKGENKGRYIIENRMDALIDELNIDKNRITGVSHKSVGWNIKMIAATALLCALSITPYIYLNLVANKLDLKRGTIWVFPILRSTGGFITATLIQLLIQRRVTTISDEYLVKRDQELPAGNGDVEAARAVASETKKYQMDARTWPLIFLLFIGLLASVVGYVGCFSIVQNSSSSSGPVSWLCLEVGLSVVRLAIWAWNPTEDDAPPLDINLELDKYEPLPTCNKDDEDILRYKVLPLTRTRDFLRSITSFVGLIKPFSNPDLSLYYTLTRKRPSILWFNKDNEPVNAEKHKLGERTLYIAVFDHKERTTRVYTRDNKKETFYSTKSDAPIVDVGHFVLEVEIDAGIDSKGDPVCSDSNILDSLREHHQSILERIRYRLGVGDVTETYALKNSWTMKAKDTISMLHRLREGDGEAVVEERREEERTYGSVASDYYFFPSIERKRRLLDEKRGKWIALRMDMITKERKEGLVGTGVEYRVNNQAVEKKAVTKTPEEVNKKLGREQYWMEALLIYEMWEWDKLFWDKFKAFLVKIGNDRVEEKERMTREWRANCWKRLNTQKHAALKRIADVDDFTGKDHLLEVLAGKESSISRFSTVFEGPGVENPISLSSLKEWIKDEDEEMRLRFDKEIEDIDFRSKRGCDLGRFDQFWEDNTLFNCRYSRSKWLDFKQNPTVPLEIYSHYLKGNKNITHITFSHLNSDFDVNRFLSELPCVTSISLPSRYTTIPHRDPLFINRFNDLDTFAKEIKLDPSSTYIFSDARRYDVYSDELEGVARVLISFVAPTSGQSLKLRIKHSGEEYAPLEVSLGSTKIQLNPPFMSSLTIDDIILYPIQVSSPESDHLSFDPGVRNDIFMRFIVPADSEFHRHILNDIELLDEDGREYMPHSASLSQTV